MAAAAPPSHQSDDQKQQLDKKYPIPFSAKSSESSTAYLTLFNAAAVMDYIQREVGGVEYPQTRASVVWPEQVSASARGTGGSDEDIDDDDDDRRGGTSSSSSS